VNKPTTTTAFVSLALLLSAGVSACGDAGSAKSATATVNPSDTSVAPVAFHVTDAQRGRLEIITVGLTSYHSSVEATGTVAFNGDKSTQVLSPIAGPVVRLVAQLGAHVSVGQTLATVSSPDFAVAVADFRKAEEAARNAKRILDRNEQLFANDALARTDLDQSRTDYASASADRDAAEQQLRSIGIDAAVITAIHDGKPTGPLEGAIRAPIPGVVVEKLINPGQLLQAGTTPAFTIADLSSMWVMASVYGSDVGDVRAGDAVDVMTDASPTPIVGHVDFVAPIVDPGTRATTVRVLTPNTKQLLKRDMFVRVRFHTSKARQGIVVPASAVLRDDDNLPFVFIANADKSFARRHVTLGAAVTGGYEITDGLKAGEQVLSNGALFVQFAEHQ
jgi:membrane fusion protein, heavy metal efflux system